MPPLAQTVINQLAAVRPYQGAYNRYGSGPQHRFFGDWQFPEPRAEKPRPKAENNDSTAGVVDAASVLTALGLADKLIFDGTGFKTLKEIAGKGWGALKEALGVAGIDVTDPALAAIPQEVWGSTAGDIITGGAGYENVPGGMTDLIGGIGGDVLAGGGAVTGASFGPLVGEVLPGTLEPLAAGGMTGLGAVEGAGAAAEGGAAGLESLAGVAEFWPFALPLVAMSIDRMFPNARAPQMSLQVKDGKLVPEFRPGKGKGAKLDPLMRQFGADVVGQLNTRATAAGGFPTAASGFGLDPALFGFSLDVDDPNKLGANIRINQGPSLRSGQPGYFDEVIYGGGRDATALADQIWSSLSTDWRPKWDVGPYEVTKWGDVGTENGAAPYWFYERNLGLRPDMTWQDFGYGDDYATGAPPPPRDLSWWEDEKARNWH